MKYSLKQRDAVSRQIVQKLWHYCNLLRDDGLSYPDYVEQLTFLIFLKMAHEQQESGDIAPAIPHGFDWSSLLKRDGQKLGRHYSRVLSKLGTCKGMLGVIFLGAKNRIQDPDKLRRLIVELIGREQWTSFDTDVKGSAYEGLLEKTSQDSKSGAGQYFTPRPLIRAIVETIRPTIAETICDPACGTCGFLLAAREFILRQYPSPTKKQRSHQKLKAYRGIELVESVARLGAMNLLLHDIGSESTDAEPPISVGDSLAIVPLARYDVVLTNPPFGKKSSVRFVNSESGSTRKPLTRIRKDFWASTANKQLNFLQHIATLLKENGRAAVIVPDNVLFESGAGEKIRKHLLENFDVHTLLRLPTGLFYAQGVKANVLYFERRKAAKHPVTRALWVYDLRTNKHFSLHKNQLVTHDLQEFIRCYSSESIDLRSETWSIQNPEGRWRKFSYQELLQRQNYNLDLQWLRSSTGAKREMLPSPEVLASQIASDLRAALSEMEIVVRSLNP